MFKTRPKFIQIFVQSTGQNDEESSEENINTLMCSRIQMKIESFNYPLLIARNFEERNQTSWRDVVTQTLFENSKILARKVPCQNWKCRLKPIKSNLHLQYLSPIQLVSLHESHSRRYAEEFVICYLNFQASTSRRNLWLEICYFEVSTKMLSLWLSRLQTGLEFVICNLNWMEET